MLSLYGNKEYIKLDKYVFYATVNKEEEDFLLKTAIEDDALVENVCRECNPELFMATRGKNLVKIYQCYSISEPGILIILEGEDTFYELY